MTRIITTDDGQRYKTPGKLTNAIAMTAGETVGCALQLGAGFALMPVVEKMGKTSSKCDNALLRQGINDAFKNSKLEAKGVELIDVKTTQGFNWKMIFKYPEEFLSMKGMPEPNVRLNKALKDALPSYMRGSKLGELYVRFIQNQVEAGLNAFYLPKGKKIGVNIDRLGASAFHEMGHAINHNCSKFWGAMQKVRGPMQLLGSTFALVAVTKRKKLEGEEPKNGFDKVTTFIKNNVWSLVTLTFVPTIAEELMASYRGNKMASKVLPKDLAKNVKTCNRLGAVSYVGGAVIAGLAAWVASGIRDKIAKPKEI